MISARGDQDELMASTAAYSGLRWGELTALTISQIDQVARAIAVDRMVVEIAGHHYLEAPKNRKHRRTIYPRRTHGGYPLADRLAARIDEARAEQEAGRNPHGLSCPSGHAMVIFAITALVAPTSKAGERSCLGRWPPRSACHGCTSGRTSP